MLSSPLPNSIQTEGRSSFSSDPLWISGYGDQVSPHVAADGDAMIGTPVGHDGANLLERAFTGEPRRKPCCRPGGVDMLVQHGVYFLRQRHGMPLRDLQGRSDAVDDVDAQQGDSISASYLK